MNPIPTPNEFLCPITKEIMQYPYVTSAGNTYEYEALQQWFTKKQLILLQIYQQVQELHQTTTYDPKSTHGSQNNPIQPTSLCIKVPKSHQLFKKCPPKVKRQH
mmetsp:Transcript_68040/g.102634  ORF Transcript_68040/g.102634 Transcript_68040/m.102634 type:complete len:104 (+) Transcript_68040:132-443(+)